MTIPYYSHFFRRKFSKGSKPPTRPAGLVHLLHPTALFQRLSNVDRKDEFALRHFGEGEGGNGLGRRQEMALFWIELRICWMDFGGFWRILLGIIGETPFVEWLIIMFPVTNGDFGSILLGLVDQDSSMDFWWMKLLDPIRLMYLPFLLISSFW